LGRAPGHSQAQQKQNGGAHYGSSQNSASDVLTLG